MRDDLVLAIDQGTSSTKCLLASPDGEIVRSASAPVPIRYPRPGWVEQDAGEILDSVLAAAARLGVAPARIAQRLAVLGIRTETAVLPTKVDGLDGRLLSRAVFPQYWLNDHPDEFQWLSATEPASRTHLLITAARTGLSPVDVAFRLSALGISSEASEGDDSEKQRRQGEEEHRHRAHRLPPVRSPPLRVSGAVTTPLAHNGPSREPCDTPRLAAAGRLQAVLRHRWFEAAVPVAVSEPKGDHMVPILMWFLGVPGIIIILLLALVVLGPKRLPELARKLGEWTAELRSAARDLRRGLEAEVADIKEAGSDLKAPLDDLKKTSEELRKGLDDSGVSRLGWNGPKPVSGPTPADAMADLEEIEKKAAEEGQ